MVNRVKTDVWGEVIRILSSTSSPPPPPLMCVWRVSVWISLCLDTCRPAGRRCLPIPPPPPPRPIFPHVALVRIEGRRREGEEITCNLWHFWKHYSGTQPKKNTHLFFFLFHWCSLMEKTDAEKRGKIFSKCTCYCPQFISDAPPLNE